MHNRWLGSVVTASVFLAWGCSSTTTADGQGAVGSGGSTGLGGTTAIQSSGGAGPASGGTSASTVTASSGGTTSTGSKTTGGSAATGGTKSGGGASTGSSKTTGGSAATGGTKSDGGASTVGSTTTGGSTATGGTGSNATTGAGGEATSTGGTAAAGGGSVSSGGTAGSNTGTGGVSAGGSTSTALTVQLDSPRQKIDGFGINDNWKALTDAQAKDMFDPNTGIGLTILRTGMKSDATGTFTNSGEASSITSAKKYGATTIIGSVWSPPANCKDNNSISKGGHLLASCHGSWSDAITKFAKDNSLYAMSAGNEADFASCQSHGPPCTVDYDTTVYTAKEMVAFVKVLGPKLRAAGVKLIAPEASEWIHVWSNASATGSTVEGHPESSDPLKCGCYSNTPTTTGCAQTCLDGNGYDYGHWLYKDKDAWAAIDILGVHEYDTQMAEPWPADVNGGKPDKPIWQTEMSGVQHWPDGVPAKDIDNGIAVAGWIHSALTVGEASAWIWWWYQAGNNEGLKLDDGSDTKRHYTYGNFSKYIRPGYSRVDITGTIPTNVLLSAYKGTDGTVVVVAIHKGTAAVEVPIAIAGGTAPASCTPYVTSASDDLAAKTAVTTSGGTLTASLPAKTVTTFVCK